MDNASKTRRLLFRLGTVLILIGICIVMMIIGRGLKAKERGMATTIGQDFEMTLKITQEKGGDEVEETYSLKLPYNLDGIVVNLPAYLAGLPEEVWMSEFVPVATSSDAEEEEVPGGDEFELDDLGDF